MRFLKSLFGKTPDGPQSEARDFLPRAPRVRIRPLHEVSFIVGDYTLDLANLSEGGLAVYYDHTPLWRVGAEIEGTLLLRHESFDVTLVVRHLSDKLAGCQFLSVTKALVTAINRYLAIELVALALRGPHLETHERGPAQAFRDEKGNEVYLVTDHRGVTQYRLKFLGHTIEGARGRSPNLDPELTKLAKAFVQNVPGLTTEHRDQIDRELAIQSG